MICVLVAYSSQLRFKKHHLGAVDAYVECGMHIWDMAAASVILTEAGM